MALGGFLGSAAGAYYVYKLIAGAPAAAEEPNTGGVAPGTSGDTGLSVAVEMRPEDDTHLQSDPSATGSASFDGNPDDSKTCPDCAERIRLQATVCRYCRRRFTSEEVAAAVQQRDVEEHENRERRDHAEVLRNREEELHSLESSRQWVIGSARVAAFAFGILLLLTVIGFIAAVTDDGGLESRVLRVVASGFLGIFCGVALFVAIKIGRDATNETATLEQTREEIEQMKATGNGDAA